MFEFVTQKMWNKKWIVLCLLIGNILLVSIAACNPMYTEAIQKKSLARNMSSFIVENNKYPGTIIVDAALTVSKQKNNAAQFIEARDKVEEIKKDIGVDIKQTVSHYYMPKLDCETQSKYGDSVAVKELSVGYMEDFKEHIHIVSGEMYRDEPSEDGTIDAVISQKGLVTQKLLVGEVLIFNNVKDANGNPLKIKISGVFENSEDDDLYWVNSPNTFTSEILISEKIFKNKYMDLENPTQKIRAAWHILADYEQMSGKNIKPLLAKTAEYKNFFAQDNSYTFRAYYADILEKHVQSERKVESTLLILQVPILVLLAAFIFMVSRQILEIEQNDISILKSRGASKKQIMITYLIQSGLLAAAGLVAGIPLGALLCQVFGSANAFLEFVQRSALHISISLSVILYSLAAVLLSVIAMILPVFKFADLTIVEHKQKNGRKSTKAWWQRYFLDIVLVAVSLYGLYTFNSQKAALAQKVAKGASLDPLLFFSSSLFIIGAGLVALRIVPLVVNGIFLLGKKKWSPSVYASFLRVIRTRNKQHFIMVFLILTIALGIFNAQAARTINTNAENRIRYAGGADIVLKEQWEDVNESSEKESEESSEKEDEEQVQASYKEPDIDKYTGIKGVKSIAKVYVTENASIAVLNDEGSQSQKVTLMGMNTKEFGETAWFADYLLPTHWYNYLNAISQNSNAILVSKNFKDVYGFALGDVLTYQTEAGQSVRGVIYGFVDYWPTYNTKAVVQSSDGSEMEVDNFLIVAHLQKLQSVDGVLPYQVWMKMDGSTQAVYDFIGAKKIKLESFTDTPANLIDMKNDPIIQGTNGTLTVGFIVVLLLCSVGFLIYWILSIKSRSLQFGIYRAMGMSMKEIINMLVCEQILISGSAIIVGSVIGVLAAKLYIPLIQIAYSTADEIIPLKLASAGGDMVKMYVVVAIIIGICMGVLGWLISEIKISQALKLGED